MEEQTKTEQTDNYIDEGDLLIEQGDFDSAIRVYTGAISREPQDGFIYFLRGDAYIIKSDYHNVIADANEAIKTGHFLDNAYLVSGKANYNPGLMGQAFEDWKTAANHGSKGALIELEKYGIKYTPLKKPQ